MNTGTMCITDILYTYSIHIRVSSYEYSKVDAAEQKDMVNLGVGNKKDRNLRTEVGCAVSYEHRTCYLPYHIQVPSTGHLYCSIGAPGGAVASGSSLVLPQSAAGTRGYSSIVHYTTQELL
jgi:hypothetical protein